MANLTNLTAARLHEVLHYDSATGIFTWRITVGTRGHEGDQAGHIDKDTGYVRIRIDHTLYRASRLAVLWMTGKFPPYDVDHINLDKTDNRWTNLREASRAQNRMNTQSRRGKKVAFKGVSWHKHLQKYRARITLNAYTIELGYFDNAEDAHTAYVAAARKYFGKFARAQ